MTYRPRATHKDSNHWIPRNYLRDRCGGYEVIEFGRTRAYTANFRGFHFVLMDLSDYGGVFSDWLLSCPENGAYCWVEVKTPEAYKSPGHDTTDGEKWLGLEFGAEFQFVVEDEDFEAILEGMTI